MRFQYNDGGRKAAGFTGKIQPGDCVCRSIAIATGMSYREVYDTINSRAKEGRKGSRKRKSSARNGVHREVYEALLKEWGWDWYPTMKVGQGCKVHLCAEELPQGTLICRVSRHMVCVKDGVLHDVYNCARDGKRCVYGYFAQEIWTPEP